MASYMNNVPGSPMAMDGPRSLAQREYLLVGAEAPKHDTRCWHQRNPVFFALGIGILMSSISGVITAGFFLYGFSFEANTAQVSLPSCGACIKSPLDGRFVGEGQLSITVLAQPLLFTWTTSYAFNASNGTVDVSVVPILNPFPRPLTAFDCPGVPYFIADYTVCNISITDACIVAAGGGTDSTPSDVYWNGADNITQIQYTTTPAGSSTTVINMVRVPDPGSGSYAYEF